MEEGKKIINIHGHKVRVSELKGAIKDLVGKRGLSGSFYVEKEMTEAERKASFGDDPPPYYNVYRYAFFE